MKNGKKGDIIQIMDLKHSWYGALAVVSGSNDNTAGAFMVVPKSGVKEVVLNHDQPGLTKWGKVNGYDNQMQFSQYKKALLQHGIDYTAMKNELKEQKLASLVNSCTHRVVLNSDAKYTHERFAVCDNHGNPLWHGKFFGDDKPVDQEKSCYEAAKKAIWLACKIKEAIAAPAVHLILKVCNLYDIGRNLQGLVLFAQKNDIHLTLEEISPHSNAADEWCVSKNYAEEWCIAKGYKKWSENDLSLLATLIPENERQHAV